jgi:sister chromatid cohesion protein DCC1
MEESGDCLNSVPCSRVFVLLTIIPVQVPTDIEPAVEMLKGLALLDVNGARTTLRMFTTDQLAYDTAVRFRKLFSMRPKWTREDLQPYLAGVLEPGQTEDQLLLKFTRVLQACQGNPRLYAPR